MQSVYAYWPPVMSFSSAASYSVFTLGAFVMIPVFWIKCPCFCKLLVALEEHSMVISVKGRKQLKSILYVLFVIVDYLIRLFTQYLWNVLFVFHLPADKFIKACAWYSLFSLPSIHTYPLALLMTVCHMLLAAFMDTNEALEMEFTRADPRHQVLRSLRCRYVYLRHLHQRLADVLAVPVILWTLNIIFTLVHVNFYMISSADTNTAEAYVICVAFVTVCAFSLFIVGSIADDVALQVRRLLTIVVFTCE